LRLGYEGYTSIINNCLINARRLALALEDLDYFNILCDVNKKINMDNNSNSLIKGFKPCLPVIAFEIKKKYKKNKPYVTEANLSKLLKIHGWIVPCYDLPPNEQNRTILRIVVSNTNDFFIKKFFLNFFFLIYFFIILSIYYFYVLLIANLNILNIIFYYRIKKDILKN